MKKIKKATVVSLSRGILGEPFIAHELNIGKERMKEFGVELSFSEHALMGLDYVQKHPEARAKDLLDALGSDTDMILCAIGGDDTYRLLPYLFDNGDLEKAAKGSDKVFLGFSDTSANHFMFNKVGMKTFYGQSFLSDVCEIDRTMLPYTEKYFREILETGTIKEITPSDIWYDTREDFSVSAVGTSMPSHKNQGFELLQGSPVFDGEILGGCIDTIFDFFNGERYADSPVLCEKYGLFPKSGEWKSKILLLETSEERPTPEKYGRMLCELKKRGVFDSVRGVIMGKPFSEVYFDEYKKIIVDVIGNSELPVVANVNIGHATPRCIIPFGVHARVDAVKQKITFDI